MNKKTIVLLALLFVAYTRSYAQNVYGALAIDRSNGFYYGWAYDYASLNGAENRAIKECTEKGGNCTIVLSWQGKSCAAYRTIPGKVGTAYGWGLAATKEEADAIATREAQKRSKGVYPSNYVWACNSVGDFKPIQNETSTPALSNTNANTVAATGLKTGTLNGVTDKSGAVYDYTGQLLNNLPHGQGTIKYTKTGDTYTGQFKNGSTNGRGVYRWPSGARYEGDFVNDHMQGKGTYTWPNGNTYTGEMANDTMNGYGVWNTPSGSQYTGTYKNGKKHGNGTLIAGIDQELTNTPKTVKYVGEFVNGDRVGYGKCYDRAGRLLYSGNFSDDRPSGTYSAQ